MELDDFLGGMAVQHREVEGHESNLFLSYFDAPIVIMEGGIESGFRTVQPTIVCYLVIRLPLFNNLIIIASATVTSTEGKTPSPHDAGIFLM